MITKPTLSQRAQWATGQPISYLMQEALARPELVSLAAGFVDQASLPFESVLTAMESVFADPTAARTSLQYGTNLGDLSLREQILARHLAADGLNASSSNLSVDRIFLTAGSNSLLWLISEILLDPGDIVFCTAPTYFVYLGGLENLGARSWGVTTDEHGMIPDALEAALRQCESAGELGRVKAIYITSYFDNPSNVTLSAERRRQIVAIAHRWSRQSKIYVIEDAAYRELRYEGEDIPSLLASDPDHETVIHTGSFSKSFAPGLRVGWGILPEALVEPLANLKGNIDFGSPHLSQGLMSEVFRLGLFDAQVERLRTTYREKLHAMLDAADEHLGPMDGVRWLRAKGGLYVWLQVEGIDTGSSGPLFRRAMDEGMLYVPGEHCYPREGEPHQTDRIRLSFGVQSPERIAEGVAALARAIADARATDDVRG